MGQRSGFDGVFVDTDGTPLVNISASILDGNNNPVTVYAAKTGAAEQAQPITTTSALPGLVKFWAEPGFYQVEITDNEIPARFASRKIPFDAVAGDTTSGSEGISVSQLDLADQITTSMLKNDSVTSDKLSDSVSTDSNRAVSTNHIKDNAVNSDKLSDSASVDADRAVSTNHIKDAAIISAKLATSAVGFSQSKITIKQSDIIVSASGEQIVGSINVNAGKYLVIAWTSAVGDLWSVRMNGGSGTMDGRLSLTSFYNTFDIILYGILTVTSAGELRLLSQKTTSGSRTGDLIVIGIEN